MREFRDVSVLVCGYTANRIRAFRVNDNIRAGVATVGTKVDEVAKKVKCGRRRGKYDDEAVAFCVAVLSAAEDNETIKSGINTRVTHSAVFDYNRREAVFRRDDDAVAGGPRTALRRPTRLKPVRDIPVKSEILV